MALSLTYPAGDAGIEAGLRFLRDQLGAETALIVGGQAAPDYQSVLSDIGAIYLTSASEMAKALGGVATGRDR